MVRVREPPLWLSDPFQKGTTAVHTLVHAAIFVVVWYLYMGYRFLAWSRAFFALLLVAFGCVLFKLRKDVRDKFGYKDNAFIHSYFGIPEAWLNMFPLGCAILATMLDHFGDTPVLPTDPVLKFAGLWACVYSITHLLSTGSHIQFYDWFHSSGLKIAERRGWGARGYDLFGVFPQTKIPRLSTNEFMWLCTILPWTLYCTLFPNFFGPSGLFFLVSFFIVLLRHSMLFAENSAGMHKPCLLPAVCWYLAFAPQMWGNTRAEEPAWPTAFLKLHIVSIYLMSGLGKVLVTWLQGKWNWADGTNMQYYLFVAMWARPGADMEALPRLGWLVQRPFVCVLLGLGGLVFEIGSPICLLGGYWSLLMFIVAFKFHYGVFILQGLDFTGQWVPCLLVFLVDRRPVCLANVLPALDGDAPGLELLGWSLAASFLFGQLFCAFTLREVTKEGNRGGMPWSCLHMFTVNSNIFGADFCSWYTLQTGDQRASGHLGITEWSGPIFTDFNMSEADMALLPFKVVWFGHTMCKHKFLEGIVKPEYHNKRFLVFSNFAIGDDFKEKLQQVCCMVEPQTDAKQIRDPNTLKRLVKLQREAQEAFFQDVLKDTKENIASAILQRGESFLQEELDNKSSVELLKLERAEASK